MKKFRKAQCPFCGKKVGILNTWVLKTQGEYKCPKCGSYSDIEMDSAVYLLAVFAAVLSALFFVAHLLLVKKFSILSLILVLLPFALFFILSAFLVRLRKPVIRKRPPAGQQRRRQSPEPNGEKKNDNDMEHTIVMDNFRKL